MVWGFYSRAPLESAPASPTATADDSEVDVSTSCDPPNPFDHEAEPQMGPSQAQASAITNLMALQLDASNKNVLKLVEVQDAVKRTKAEFETAVQAIKADHEAAVLTIKAAHEAAIQTVRAEHNASIKAMRTDQEVLRAELEKQIGSLQLSLEILRQTVETHAPGSSRSLSPGPNGVASSSPGLADAESFNIEEFIIDPCPDVQGFDAGEESIDLQEQQQEAVSATISPGLLRQEATPSEAAADELAQLFEEVEETVEERSSSSAEPVTPVRELVADSATTTSGRPRRLVIKRKDYHSHPLDGIINRKGSTPKRPRIERSDQPEVVQSPLRQQSHASASSSAVRPRQASKSQTPSPASRRGSATGRGRGSARGRGRGRGGGKSSRGRRSFHGRVTMNDQTLRVSDGEKKGNGVWPAKGENTVKGNVQEIECEICFGRVHWACAGFEDTTIAPDEWQCPDCKYKLRRGVAAEDVARGPSGRCLRWSCIKKDHKKIQIKDGDENEYVVERFIGRRAIGRNEDKTRIFEYLVDWHGWDLSTATWEPGTQWPPTNAYIDEFLQECSHQQLSTRPRTVLLKEALKYFDPETGKRLGEESSHEEEQEEEEEETDFAIIDGTARPKAPTPLFLPADEE